MSRPPGPLAPALLLLLAAGATPALAVGFGPLLLNGTIDGPREGFSLDLLNADPDAGEFDVYAVGWDDEARQSRVDVLPASAMLGAHRNRKVLVIASDLQPGETYRFRVCAERRPPAEGLMIHARVCSKITAHRLD